MDLNKSGKIIALKFVDTLKGKVIDLYQWFCFSELFLSSSLFYEGCFNSKQHAFTLDPYKISL